MKFQQHLHKISKKYRKFIKIVQKSENFAFGAVQKYANLVDLEKCRKMSIYLQKSASIQPRMSPLEFGPACLPRSTHKQS